MEAWRVDAEEDGGERPSHNRVREVREHRLMTQADLARKAGVALRTIHSVEKGMRCRLDTKRKLLAALGVPFASRDEVFPPGEVVRVRRGSPRRLTRLRSAD